MCTFHLKAPPGCNDRLCLKATSRCAALLPHLAKPQPVPACIPAVVFFGQQLSPTVKLGTAVTLLGTLLYTEAIKASKAPAPAPATVKAPHLAAN
jgi:hypothetical protein